jgi:hypothetical protein
MAFESFAFYESQYARESDRKDHLNSAVSIPMGIVGALIGALAVYIPIARAQFVDARWLWVWIVAIVAIGMTIYYLVRAYYRHPYTLVTDAAGLLEYQNQLRAYHSGGGGITAADQDFENEMIKKFANAASQNARSNDRKSGFLHHAMTYLLLAGLMVPIGGLPILAGALEAKEQEIYKVQIAAPERVYTRKSECPVASRPPIADANARNQCPKKSR